MNRDQIEKRLPHAGDMVLVDRIISWSYDQIVCGSHSHRAKTNPLRTGRGLSVLAGIEYAGQAIALHSSLTSREPLTGGVLAVLRDVRWEPGGLTFRPEELIIYAGQRAKGADAASYEFRLTLGDQQVLAGTAVVAFRRRERATAIGD